MTLTAKYNCGYYNDNYYYGDDYYYNDDYYYGNDYYYGDNNSYYNNYNLATATITSTVYTAGWDDYGTNTVSINHTLRLPNSLDNSRVAKVRIRNISYGGPINNASAVNAYNSRHANTFLYALTGSEYYNSTAYNFATINRNAVAFYYNTNYKTLSNALSNGFDVSWMATSVASQCLQTFNVKNSYNLCGYGIYYNVTWEYQYYKN